MKINITGDVYGVGDIHGDTSILCVIIDSYDIKDCTLILLGDIGIWRYRDYKHYINFDNACRERNIICYAFRGNHDNPAFFVKSEDQAQLAKRFWEKFTNFKVIPDLTNIIINGASGIVIGGGASIDRCIRRSFQDPYRRNSNLYKQNDWWVDEVLPDTRHINETFDFILSHTGPRPLKVAPISESNCSFFRVDDGLKDYIAQENKRLEEIYHQFKPKKWWFGHFHINDSFEFFDAKCTAVDINYLSPIHI